MVNYIMPPNFRQYCDFLKVIFLAQDYYGKVPRNTQKLAEHGHSK